MQLDPVTFNGTQPTFVKVIDKILRQWGELPHAHGPIRTVGGMTDEHSKNLDRLRQEREAALAAGEVTGRSTAALNVYSDDEVIVTFYLYTDEALSTDDPPIFAQVEYGRLDTQIAPHDRTCVMATARDPLMAEMRRQWARLKDELSRQGWIDPQIVQPSKIDAGDEHRITVWHGTGQRPKTQAEKRAAKAAWDSIPLDNRPPLEEWLEAQFGIEPDGSLSVKPSTFHSWKKFVVDS